MSAAQKPCILYIEDEELVRVPLARSLTQAGYNIIVCENYFDASDWLDAGNRPDLLLTDFNYIGEKDNKGGLDTAKKVQELFGDGVPRILMSGLASAVKENAEDRKYFNMVFEKPVKTDVILAALKSSLEAIAKNSSEAVSAKRETALDTRNVNTAAPLKNPANI